MGAARPLRGHLPRRLNDFPPPPFPPAARPRAAFSLTRWRKPPRCGVAPRRHGVTPRRFDPTPRRHDPTPIRLDATPRRLDVTPRRLDATPRRLDVTPRRLGVTQRRLGVTQRRLDVTQRRLDVYKKSQFGGQKGGFVQKWCKEAIFRRGKPTPRRQGAKARSLAGQRRRRDPARILKGFNHSAQGCAPRRYLGTANPFYFQP